MTIARWPKRCCRGRHRNDHEESTMQTLRRRSGRVFGAQPVRATGLDVRGPGLRGPTALASLAIGAAAIGALAIGRLAIGRASIKRLAIEDLDVRRLRVEELVVVREQRPSAVEGQ